MGPKIMSINGIPLPEDERERVRMRRRIRERERRSRDTPEEKERRLARIRELRRERKEKERRSEETPEERWKRRERGSLQKRKYREKAKEGEKGGQKRSKDPEKEKIKRFKDFARKANMTAEEKEEAKVKRYFERLAREAKMSKEEFEEFKVERAKRWRDRVKSLTGEKMERHKASVKRAITKWNKKNSHLISERHTKLNANMTPEQRWKQLLYYRITQAKRNLKKKLEKEGASQEEIEEEVKKLVDKMKSEPMPPPNEISKYKPRSNLIAEGQTNEETADKAWKGLASGSQTGSIALNRTVAYQLMESMRSDSNQDNLHISETTASNSEEYYSQVPSPTSPSSPIDYFEKEIDTAPVEDKLNQTDINSSFNDKPRDKPDDQIPKSEDRCFSASKSQFAVLTPDASPILNQSLPQLPSTNRSKTDNRFPDDIFSSNHPKQRSTASGTIDTVETWKCPFPQCKSLSFPSPKEFTCHYQIFHKNPPHPPPDNIKAATNEKKPLTNLKAYPFICMKCPVTLTSTSASAKSHFQTKADLLAHVKARHPLFYFPCNYCKLLKYSSPKLQLHTNICQKFR